MDHINKRKVDLWEDDWEKQIDDDTKKRYPPNKAAAYIAVLEQQHDDLSRTCLHLESTLASLTTKLDGLQSSLLEEQTKSQGKQEQHRQRVAQSLERMTTKCIGNHGCLGTLHENQQDLDRVLSQHQVLSDTLNQLEAYYEASLPSSVNRNKPMTHDLYGNGRLDLALRMARLITTHNLLEERYIDAKSKTEAYKAGAHVLEKEIKKINGLPRLVPILNAATEQYQKETLYQRQCQDDLRIPEMIKHMGDLRVRLPLLATIQAHQNRHLYQTASRLKKIYQGLLHQRSNQQVLSYSYQVEMKYLLHYKRALLAYRTDLLDTRNQEKPTTLDERIEQQQADFMTRVKQTLATYQHKLKHANHNQQSPLDPHVDYTRITDEQLIDTIKNLVNYEAQWNKKWSEDINDNLDGIQLLDQAKQDLITTLFGDSVSRQTLEIKPKVYDDLQWTVENMTSDMKKEADQLKNEIQVDDQVFQDRRTFVSLFFTDPLTFESKMDSHLDSLAARNNLFDSLY